MSENVLILGATSDIARAVARRLAARGCHLVLAGRRREELERDAADLAVRYQVRCSVANFDATDLASHRAVVEQAIETFGGEMHGVLACHGYLPNPQQAETDAAEARRTIDVNFTSVVSCFAAAAEYMERRRGGWLAAISSVAGDRGRKSNFLYGAAKAGLNVYLQGLRQRLYRSQVHVLTIKPGFVDTAMTRGLLNPRSPLVATPDRVARDIDRALQRRRNVLYTPWFWKWILLLVRSVPEWLFKRL